MDEYPVNRSEPDTSVNAGRPGRRHRDLLSCLGASVDCEWSPSRSYDESYVAPGIIRFGVGGITR
jgi:hypothetical protein